VTAFDVPPPSSFGEIRRQGGHDQSRRLQNLRILGLRNQEDILWVEEAVTHRYWDAPHIEPRRLVAGDESAWVVVHGDVIQSSPQLVLELH
jgi:hypothetical protein